MNLPFVYIIVLNWNGKNILSDCLNSLMSVKYDNYKVLLVDNGSSDGSVDYVKNEYPDVELLVLEKNYGYAGGNNLGFDYAKGKKAKFVIFLNNDTIVDENFVEPLLVPFNDPNVGQTVPKIYYADEKEKIWYAGGRVNLWTGNIFHEGIREYNNGRFDQSKITDYATGCCFCVKMNDFEKLNGFDESFSMYGEDVDLSIRVKQSGRKIVIAPKSHIWHKVSSSIGGEFSFKKIIRKYRGYLKLYQLHATPSQWITTVICSPFLLLTNIIKYFRLRFFDS